MLRFAHLGFFLLLILLQYIFFIYATNFRLIKNARKNPTTTTVVRLKRLSNVPQLLCSFLSFLTDLLCVFWLRRTHFLNIYQTVDKFKPAFYIQPLPNVTAVVSSNHTTLLYNKTIKGNLFNSLNLNHSRRSKKKLIAYFIYLSVDECYRWICL